MFLNTIKTNRNLNHAIHDMRFGNLVNRDCGEKTWVEMKKAHPNTILLSGFVKTACRAIGKSTVHRRGLDGTTHTGGFISALAYCVNMLRDRRLKKKLKEGRVRGLVLARYHDATPYSISFGSLQANLLPILYICRKWACHMLSMMLHVSMTL